MDRFPTPVHRRAAETIVDFFQAHDEAKAVLLVNSTARGRATPESDLDIAVLITPKVSSDARQWLEEEWQKRYGMDSAFSALAQQGPFCRIHLDLFDGQYRPQIWDDGGGPDYFEVEIGNQIARSLPLWQRDHTFDNLKAAWLPYYEETLRLQRMAMVRDACFYDLDHIPHFVRRGLYFAAFDRLYKAFQEFLQGVFIARRVYPIAYNKWIREQIVEWLGLPELYALLPSFMEIRRLESDEMIGKAETLCTAIAQWIVG